jgi:hypothetical protein
MTVTPSDEQVAALRRAAREDGVDRDGLRATRDDGGFVLETPGRRREGLDDDEFAVAAREAGACVTDWHYWRRERPADHEAFLRWVEGADGSVPASQRYAALAEETSREWGQLRVTARLGGDGPPGERRYDLRHVDDAGVPAGELERHDDPFDVRDLATVDERGRYRPLKTAPSLVDGWAFPDLPGADLVRAVDAFYPATIANWYREREGELDVTHWRETAERQTGIYDVVEELSDEQVEWIAESCCVDSQCLKRREWDQTEDEPLGVPRGEGAFPCREPCSLVIAAARKWTRLEREQPREYTFELTPSEKEQLEAIVEAVADGRTDEIREADVYEGANRYRARFLRAKRFDDEGRLGGVPAESDGSGE